MSNTHLVATKAIVKKMLPPERVIVQLVPGGGQATIQQENNFPGLPVDWMFKLGQELTGVYDSVEGTFVVNSAKLTPEQFIVTHPLNSVTLGIVKTTDRQKATIQVHPNLVFEVAKHEITGNPFDVVSKYLDVGDVVSVRVYRNAQGKIRLRLDDIEDDEVVLPALSLIEGAEPWLSEGRDLVEPEIAQLLNEETLEVEVRVSAPDVTDELAILEKTVSEMPAVAATSKAVSPREISLMRESISHLKTALNVRDKQIADWQYDYNRLLDTYKDLKAEYGNALRVFRESAGEAKNQRRENRKSANKLSTTFTRRNRFDNDEEWLREEIRRVWFGRYTPEDRVKYSLDQNNFKFGKAFFKSFTSKLLDEDEARKTVRAILDLVTGRNGVENIRESHPVLEDGKAIIRDGDQAMRMHLENGTAQAKRLTYYKLRDGKVELTKVAMHDDFGA